MNAIKYGVFLVALSASTAAFAASDGMGAGAGAAPAADGQSGAASGMTDGAPPALQEGRSAKQSPNNNPSDAPTGVGGHAKDLGSPRAPNLQGN